MIDARSTLRRRFVTLTALRWLSSGMLVPVFVVLLKARRSLRLPDRRDLRRVHGGRRMLEVPTGGLADTWGRRPTLLTASATTMIGFIGLSMSTDVLMLATSASILAVGRALASGPLDAWFVDHMRTVEPDLDLTADLAAGARAQDSRWPGGPWPGASSRTPVTGCRLKVTHSCCGSRSRCSSRPPSPRSNWSA